MCIEASKWEEAKCLQQIPNKYTLSLLCRRDQTGTFESSFPTKNCTHARKKRPDKAYKSERYFSVVYCAQCWKINPAISHYSFCSRIAENGDETFYVDYKPLCFSGCKEKKRPWEARALVGKYANVKLS